MNEKNGAPACWSVLAAECARAYGDGTPALPVREAQWTWLSACLRRNAGCVYGRRHGFEAIASADEFRERVPLCDYETLRPRIEAIARGATGLLYSGATQAFEYTGGSTGSGSGNNGINNGGKLIPYTGESLQDFARALMPWISGLAARYGLSGRAYWSISPAARRPTLTEGGISIGLPDAAYLGELSAAATAAFSGLSAAPASLSTLCDIEEWQRQTWYWLLRCDDLELISVWSPSFMLALFDALPRHADALSARLGAEGRDAAARRLGSFLGDGDASRLWPRLKLVSCWRDGMSRTFYETLQKRLPQAAFQPKGLLASEGVVTVPDAEGAPVLATSSGFFEFLDAGGKSFLAHELETGERYEVVMTTAAGLYRYRSGDLVRCEGRERYDGRGDSTRARPILSFLGRAGLVSDLTGEKLTEAFVTACLPRDGRFHLLLPSLEPAPHYVLLADADEAPLDAAALGAVERRLAENPQYRYARALGQLHPLRCRRVRALFARYCERMGERGVRLGDIKAIALRPETDWLDYFTPVGDETVSEAEF